MNDYFQVAADMLKEVARRLEDEPQWVPACWMQEMWTLAAEIVIILDTTSHVSCCLLLVSNHDGYVMQHIVLIIRDLLFLLFKTILFDLLPIQNHCRVYKVIHNHVHQLHVLLLVFRMGAFVFYSTCLQSERLGKASCIQRLGKLVWLRETIGKPWQ